MSRGWWLGLVLLLPLAPLPRAAQHDSPMSRPVDRHRRGK
jgi:hypothetical protein